MVKLYELASAVADARESIERAERLAYEISGADGGNRGGEWIERVECASCGGSGGGDDPVLRCRECKGQGSYEIAHSAPTIEPTAGWPAMLAVVDRLAAILPLVDAAIGEEVTAAIKEEHDEDMRYD